MLVATDKTSISLEIESLTLRISRIEALIARRGGDPGAAARIAALRRRRAALEDFIAGSPACR